MNSIKKETTDIQPIGAETVHRICSGQVVISLAVAVKELVENALDAGATNIDIRFKNYGVDLIEVSDNGTGVTEDNFAALTLKYHTSKLCDYSDLLGVTSFGFRGEALSSLASLANLTITTRHKSTEYATKIEYDHKGNIIKKTPCSRQIGTTVSLKNLFVTLPVRYKEFQKNVKREFNKMTQLLYAYCLISVGVKITCSNQSSSNTKSVVVATQGSTSYKDNVASIFGIKQLQTLLDIKPENVENIKDNIFKGLSGEVKQANETADITDVEIDLSEDSNDSERPVSIDNSQKSQGYKNVTKPVEFVGFISSCAHGSGRSSTDRQFYFVNSRPCEPTKVIKLVNEIYRQYNSNQYPFVFLNVDMEKTSVDVNVTPDKRKVFLTKEKIILDVLKCSLLKLFENIPRTLKVETPFSQDVQNHNLEADKPRIFQPFLQQFQKRTALAEKVEKQSISVLKRKSTTMLDYVTSKSVKLEDVDEEDDYGEGEIERNNEVREDLETDNDIKAYSIKEIVVEENNKETSPDLVKESTNKQNYNLQTSTEIIEKNQSNGSSVQKLSETKHEPNTKLNENILYLGYGDHLPSTQIINLSDAVIKKESKSSDKTFAEFKRTSSKAKKTALVTDKEDLGKNQRRSVTLKTSLDHVKALLAVYKESKKETTITKLKFKSGINPVFNKKCEEELSREISKESFRKMKIIGQFNLGFIITQLENDLFIIDQHATDEIYNFEMLQKTTELTSQTLVIPQHLELTGVNEQILMDNLEVFKKNGFTFEINGEAMPTKRVKLLTVPMSKNWIFGKEDIEELLFMLRESPSEYCRPSRVRAMFASRACRKSVMIGTALGKNDMKKLVDHMAEIDKPWNCPHGRPTIRHLVNLAMVRNKDNFYK